MNEFNPDKPLKTFKVKDPLPLPERAEKIREVLYKLTKTKLSKGTLSDIEKGKIIRDDLISTFSFMENMEFSIDGKKFDPSGLEKGINAHLDKAAIEARDSDDKQALSDIAEQKRKLTLREDIYKNKQRQIAFGRRLLEFIGKFKSLPNTRYCFELYLKQSLNDFEFITHSKTTYNDCYQLYEINKYVNNQRNR